MEVLVGGEDAHPLDLVHLRGEEGHELLEGVHILPDHLPDHQVVVHVGVVVHLHELEGEVAGDPALPAADHHVGHVEDAVGVHIVVDGGAVGPFGPGAVEAQDLFLVVGAGVGEAGLVPEGTDHAGSGLIEGILVAGPVAHLPVEGGHEGVQTADGCTQLLVVPHEDAEHGHGRVLLLPEEVGGHVGRRSHGHHHASDVEGEIHHQDGTHQGPIVVKTAEVASLVRLVQLAFHVPKQRRRRLGREGAHHVAGELVPFGGKNEPDLHGYTPLMICGKENNNPALSRRTGPDLLFGWRPAGRPPRTCFDSLYYRSLFQYCQTVFA